MIGGYADRVPGTAALRLLVSRLLTELRSIATFGGIGRALQCPHGVFRAHGLVEVNGAIATL